MPSSHPPPPSRWPNGAKAAVSFTMDNLGEAQDVRTGTWPPDQPYGTHPAVLTTLPRILDLLDGGGGGGGGKEEDSLMAAAAAARPPLKATYFAESWSLPVYPDAVAALRARGHEVAWHGFQHEVWHSLSEEEEASNFARSFEMARKHGVRYEGFRPPGGDINGARTLGLFGKYGVKYVSPLGTFGIADAGAHSEEDDKAGGQVVVVVLPFEWETVDAFWYMEKFAGIRKKHGVQEEPLAPDVFKAYLFNKFEEVVKEGGYISILFHPFLTTSEEKFKVLEEVLQRLREDPNIWVAPCNEVAKWVSDHAEEFGFKRQ